MNIKMTVFAILTGCVTVVGLRAEEGQPFKDEKDKASYAVGLNYGSNLKRQEIELDANQFFQGFKDAYSGKPLLTEQEMRDVLNAYSQSLRAKQEEKRKQLAEKNKKEGEAFLAENKNKPGVLTLGTNGLQYKILTEGSGDIPKSEDTVSVNYRGTLIDGTEFDSSAKAGKPYVTPVTRVIRGWTEALTRMKAGSKWQLFIPSDLAYGESGKPPSISPGATLIFEVELVSIQAPPPPVTNAPLTSDIIKVPSLEEMKKGAKIETIKAEDVEKLQKQQQQQEKEKEKQKPK
jgi:FKBP-type peptidyl-prolyl cis-trans isomerase FklB